MGRSWEHRAGVMAARGWEWGRELWMEAMVSGQKGGQRETPNWVLSGYWVW